MCARAADSTSTHKFPWKWELADLAKVPKNGLRVLSTFACGGGSSMGYKLAGYTVLGNVEIDPAIAAMYKENNHPQMSFVMDIREFNKKCRAGDVPPELFELDVLDGSPPCSTFSMAGSREKGWGKEKVFREGQKKQRLDDLFFVFLETVEILKPKVVVAENVEGLLRGNAKGYVKEIVEGFRKRNYVVQLFLLDAAKMGVPQNRRRCFFVAHRNDIQVPALRLEFNEPVIAFGDVRTPEGKPLGGKMGELAKRRKFGDKSLCDVSERDRGKSSMYTTGFVYDSDVCQTIVSGSRHIRFCDGMQMSDGDIVNVQTFPQDYNFCGQDVNYVCGMSVPPVMMAHIAKEIEKQWLRSKEK